MSIDKTYSVLIFDISCRYNAVRKVFSSKTFSSSTARNGVVRKNILLKNASGYILYSFGSRNLNCGFYSTPTARDVSSGAIRRASGLAGDGGADITDELPGSISELRKPPIFRSTRRARYNNKIRFGKSRRLRFGHVICHPDFVFS